MKYLSVCSVMRWIGERIAAVDAILRDGAGTGSVS
jgi:hypothetical protein